MVKSKGKNNVRVNSGDVVSPKMKRKKIEASQSAPSGKKRKSNIAKPNSSANSSGDDIFFIEILGDDQKFDAKHKNIKGKQNKKGSSSNQEMDNNGNSGKVHERDKNGDGCPQAPSFPDKDDVLVAARSAQAKAKKKGTIVMADDQQMLDNKDNEDNKVEKGKEEGEKASSILSKAKGKQKIANWEEDVQLDLESLLIVELAKLYDKNVMAGDGNSNVDEVYPGKDHLGMTENTCIDLEAIGRDLTVAGYPPDEIDEVIGVFTESKTDQAQKPFQFDQGNRRGQNDGQRGINQAQKRAADQANQPSKCGVCKTFGHTRGHCPKLEIQNKFKKLLLK